MDAGAAYRPRREPSVTRACRYVLVRSALLLARLDLDGRLGLGDGLLDDLVFVVHLVLVDQVLVDAAVEDLLPHGRGSQVVSTPGAISSSIVASSEMSITVPYRPDVVMTRSPKFSEL